MKTILITGANGFIGRNIVKSLYGKFKLILLDKNIEGLNDYKDFTKIIETDMSDFNLLEELLKNGDVLIHLAAKVYSNPSSEEEIKEYIVNNTEHAKKVIDLAIKQKVKKILFFSTNDVYEASTETITENTRPNPSSLYGKTKLNVENFINSLELDDSKIMIFRPASVFGEGDKGSMKSIIKLSKLRIVPVVGNGDNKKSLLYIKDLINAVNLFIEGDIPMISTINLSSGEYSMTQIVDTVEKVFGRKVLKLRIPNQIIKNGLIGKKVANKLRTASSTKVTSNKMAKELINFNPSFNLLDALEDSKSYYENI